MAKGLPFLLLRNSAILKPKNQNEDIWNSNGDVPTVGNTNSCFATHFWGCRSKKWRLSLRNWGCALCFHGLKLNGDKTYSAQLPCSLWMNRAQFPCHSILLAVTWRITLVRMRLKLFAFSAENIGLKELFSLILYVFIIDFFHCFFEDSIKNRNFLTF